MMQTKMTSAEVIKIAQQWLEQFDQENFSMCWQCASPELKKQVDETDFVMIMSDKHSTQGSVASRKLLDEGSEMTYYKRPEMVHWVLRFEANFTAGNQSQELVTLVKGEGDIWQVANYTVL